MLSFYLTSKLNKSVINNPEKFRCHFLPPKMSETCFFRFPCLISPCFVPLLVIA